MARVVTTRDLGALVRHHRVERGMTLTDLVALSGVSRRTLAGLEAGSAGVRVGSVLNVLAALGVHLEAKPGGAEGPDLDLDEMLSRFDEDRP